MEGRAGSGSFELVSEREGVRLRGKRERLAQALWLGIVANGLAENDGLILYFAL
jgi:hypothetical protein